MAVLVTLVTAVLEVMAESVFTVDQMYIIRPILVCGAVFVLFSYILSVRIGTNLFGEIGFVYLALALAYTILPGLAFLLSNFAFPLLVDGLNFIDLSPLPVELGRHFWRHLLFISGVAAGYLLVRGGDVLPRQIEQRKRTGDGRVITVWIAVIVGSMLAVRALSAPVTTYLENYTRFDHLSWPLLRLAYVCLSFKSGGYFILLALLFRNYRRYKILVFALVPLIGVYESINSFGSRIETLTVLLAFIAFYNLKVKPISINKGVAYLLGLAVLFSAIELFRSSAYSLADARYAATQEDGQQVAEFGAVYNTSFHLYSERAQGALPERPWQMFFYEFVAIVPFLDHTTNHPQYWYARNYFPQAAVPPQTMGVLADSAIWGGELDLLVRSLLNGVLFAYLTRWFLRRRNEWLASNIYVFCYATCVLTLKYSVFYQLVPMMRLLVPTLLFTEVLFRLQKASGFMKAAVPQPAA
jgi:hypothetical protein